MATDIEKKLVLARLETMPLDMELSLGSHGSFGKENLIHEVERGSEVGELVIEVYMNYLRFFKQKVH
jgi:hypothetical protein